MAAIHTRNLTKHFGDVIAVENLNLTVEEGEIFGFLGPNGAGKSTTIDILLDFIRPTTGSAHVLGLDTQENGLAVRQRTGVLPDAFHVYDRLTGRQHLEFAIDMKSADDDPMALLERVNIPEAADRKAGGYSKGMRQRMVLAMALVGDPDLLILDEPSTGLDPNGAREMRQIILDERDRGATIFFSSHIMEQVEAVCDRVAIINRGELVAVDTVEALRDGTGTGETLLVYTETVDNDIREQAANLEMVIDVTIDDGRLRITAEEGSKLEMLVSIDTHISPVEDFSIIESSLEDLFVQFTSDTQEVRT